MNAPRPLGLSDTRRLLAAHHIVPSKALGQNFVVDPNMLEHIVRLAKIAPGEHVVEIGPGLGSLSAALLATGAALTVVEVDARLVKVLEERFGEQVRIVHADALGLDWGELLGPRTPEAPQVVLVANLPYNIATPLVLEILEREARVVRLLVMVQREVGERLVAQVGSDEYGQVSVRVSYFARARLVGKVPPAVFFPRPRVESALVAIERRHSPAVDPAIASYEEILVLVRAGFAVRRKMLRRSLSGLVTPEVFAAAGVDARARAEELDVGQWGKLAACRRNMLSSPTPS